MGCHAIRQLDEVAGHVHRMGTSVHPIRSKGLGDVLEITILLDLGRETEKFLQQSPPF